MAQCVYVIGIRQICNLEKMLKNIIKYLSINLEHNNNNIIIKMHPLWILYLLIWS